MTVLQLTVTLLILPVILFLYFGHRTDYHERLHIRRKPGIWYIGSAGFFIHPYRFLKHSMTWAEDSMFSFRILGNTIVVLRGISGRDAFFTRGLDFMAGYRLLNSELDGIARTVNAFGDLGSMMSKFFGSNALERLSPLLVEDAFRVLEKWGDDGANDPFTSLNEIVFTLAARFTVCREFSEDPKKIQALISIFKRLEAGSSHTSALFPWFPTPARLKKLVAGVQLYRMISAAVLSRKENGYREDDPLQAMIDKGLSLTETTALLAMLFVGATTNTGNVVTWILIYLEANPKWKLLVQNEARQLYEDSQTLGPYHDTPQQLLTMTSIEKQTPIIDCCISETLRMLFTCPFLRKNVGDDIFVDQKCVPHGVYVMFPTADLHGNPCFYPEPNKFNPENFSAGAVLKRQQHGTTFLGWGAGHHVCPGRRAAQIIIKIIVILILSKFDTRILDEGGELVQKVPEQLEDTLFRVLRAKEAMTLCYGVRH
ncbi:cytochrome P450 [Suillus decipiens]|nr:cytochrome P450 [Suillus decipiens]